MGKRLDYIDYFRGISILGVVLAHAYCWGFDYVYNINWYLLGGTAYFFVFISGFIFQYNAHKFEFVEFFKKRFVGLLIPYIFVIAPIALSYTINNQPEMPFYKLDFLHRFVAVFFGGFTLNPPIWFVGVIFIFFALSPILLYIQRKHYWLFIITVLVSLYYTLAYPRACLVLHNEYNYTGWSDLLEFYSGVYMGNTVHFLFFYVFGMWVYILLNKYGDFIKKHIKKIALISFNLVLIHFAYSVDFHRNLQFWESSYSIIQIILILSLLIIYEDTIRQNLLWNKILKFLSDYSFGIFLVHYVFINIFLYHTLYVQLTPTDDILHRNTLNCFLTSVSLFLFTLFGTIALLYILKKVLIFFGVKNTRRIIGV